METETRLSFFSKKYRLNKYERIRLYTFFSRQEVKSLYIKDILIDEKTANQCLLSFLNFKRCGHCGKILRRKNFNVDKNKWDKRSLWCELCQESLIQEKI